MNIIGIFLINEIRTGGDKDYINLLETLAERGNKVFVIINKYLDYQPKFIIPIYLSILYVIHKFPPASYLFKIKIKNNFPTIINSFSGYKADYIYIHGDIYLKSAIYLKKQLNSKLFYCSRANDISRVNILLQYKAYTSVKLIIFYLLYNQINKFREKQISKYANIVSFLNPTDMEYFKKRTKRYNNIIIIPNNINFGTNMNFYNKNNSHSVYKIVYVGSLSRDKGLYDLLKAAFILKNKNYNLLYYILGKIENDNNLLELTNKLNLNENIRLEGYVSPFSYFIDCDLFVYPTLYDSFGNVITEALFCGCPVIASKSAGPSYILNYDDLLFELAKPEDIAKKIEQCIIDNNYYNRIRSLCSERIKEFQFDLTEKYEHSMLEYLS